jgi:two-component system cell cycle response regulator
LHYILCEDSEGGKMGQQEDVNILLVDDRKGNLLALEKLLAAPGLNIMKATSGNTALSLALKHDFALVLMDVQMPGMDGFETAELMRGAENTKHVPIIFVTAISKEQENVFKGYDSGAVDYLFKPLDPDILLAKVNIFLELHRHKADLLRINQGLREANRKILDQQKALIKEERLKVLLQMAGATAHELNQPLTVLLGSIEMMELDRTDPEQLLSHAENAKEAGQRIAEIVKRIQTIRRYETKQYAMDSQILQFDQKVRVLSIEDSISDFLAIQTLLQEETSIELNHASDLETAFRELEETAYDLVLFDHILGGEDAGEDFFRGAAKRKMKIPIVAITGKGDEMLASRMIQAGASGYLPKSELNRDSLTREIYQGLEKARLIKAVRLAQERLADISTRDA